MPVGPEGSPSRAGSTPPPPEATTGASGPSLRERAGEACALALAVAALAAVPTALRTSGAGGSLFGGWLVGLAVLVPIAAAAIGLSRAAGRGFRAILGTEPPRLWVLGIALWIGLAVPALAVLGTALEITTHHRGLAGATFGVLGLVAVAATAFVAHRLVGLAHALVGRGVAPWIVAAVGGAIGTLPILVLAMPLWRGAASPVPGAADAARSVHAAMLDGGIVLVATALAATVQLGRRRALAAAVGLPLAALVTVGGLARAETAPALAAAIEKGGGLPATVLAGLAAWSDRDGDGRGAHFGGGDCDEGDARRHPGAVEIAGDGVDEDCDGFDPPGAAPEPVVATRPAASAAPAGAEAQPKGPALPAGSPPDVVLVTLDTVRADHTSAYGYAEPTTPALQALAERGTLFEHAYGVASDTQHAIVPLVSGRRYSRTPHEGGEWPTLEDQVDTISERMKRAGYATAAVVSFNWMSEKKGFGQGYDRFETAFSDAHPEKGVTGDHAARRAVAILEQSADKPRPIFLWVHLFDAHARYLEHPGIHVGKGKTAAYDGEIAFVDRQLGAIVDAVAKSKRADRTAFVVCGTFGDAFGEHGQSGHGEALYDENLRVPLVVALPGQKPGRYAAHAVSMLDVAPTVLAIGHAESDGIEGESLLPIAEGDLARAHAPVFAWSRKQEALVDFPLELLATTRRRKPRLALFDLSADPSQEHDLAADRPDDVARLDAERKKLEDAP